MNIVKSIGKFAGAFRRAREAPMYTDELFRQIVEHAPNAKILINATGKIVLANLEAERLFGYGRADLLGQLVEMLLPERYRAQHPVWRRAFFDDPKIRRMGAGRDLYGLRRDGTEVPIEIGLTPIQTPQGVLALAAIIDTTERRRLEERFRQVVESAPNAMVMIDTDGKIGLVNLEAERLFGYDRSELLGNRVEMLVPDRFRRNHPASRAGFFTDPAVRRMGAGRDLYAVKKDGSEFPVEIGLNPIQTDGGLMALAAIVDITARSRLEERVRQVVEAAPYAMLMFDVNGSIGLVNPEAERMFGYSREELLGQRTEMLVPERFRAGISLSRPRFFAAAERRSVGPWPGPEVMMRKDGTEFPVEYGVNPISTDDGLMALTAIVDITERVRATRRLEEQANELQRSNKDLEQFAYIASHDLKAPMRGIDNAAKWLETDLEGKLNDETQKILQLMRSRIDRMERLLDDLLAYSRAGRTDTTVERTSLSDLLENIIQVLAVPEHIKVRFEGEFPVIRTARAQLEQVLRNLISNAIKHHNKPRGEVVVSTRKVGDEMEFAVRDDGPGIPPEYHETIFKLFQTLKRRDEVEGSGMGLAIVKKLVEQQQCLITVHSEGDGKGTEFRFRWPIAPSTDTEKGAPNA